MVGFGVGVFMFGGDNVLTDSTISKTFDQGVITGGDGCMTIDNVVVSSSEDDGFILASTGQVVMTNSAALYNEVS